MQPTPLFSSNRLIPMLSVDPLFAFAFLQSFVDILQEYFGTVCAATLKDNFDVVYQVRNSQSADHVDVIPMPRSF